MTGKTIEFSNSSITYNGKSYSNPNYTKTNISSNEFEKNYKISLSKINITKDSVDKVLIDYYDGMNDSDESGIGQELFIKDNNTLVLVFNGDYFELSRE